MRTPYEGAVRLTVRTHTVRWRITTHTSQTEHTNTQTKRTIAERPRARIQRSAPPHCRPRSPFCDAQQKRHTKPALEQDTTREPKTGRSLVDAARTSPHAHAWHIRRRRDSSDRDAPDNATLQARENRQSREQAHDVTASSSTTVQPYESRSKKTHKTTDVNARTSQQNVQSFACESSYQRRHHCIVCIRAMGSVSECRGTPESTEVAYLGTRFYCARIHWRPGDRG